MLAPVEGLAPSYLTAAPPPPLFYLPPSAMGKFGVPMNPRAYDGYAGERAKVSSGRLPGHAPALERASAR
jgi:hypothetical protein